MKENEDQVQFKAWATTTSKMMFKYSFDVTEK